MRNVQADEINEREISRLRTRKFVFNAKDEGRKARTVEIQGLKLSLKICCGAFVMLTTNLNVQTGLVNGATGKVKCVLVDQSERMIGCMVDFANYKGNGNNMILIYNCLKVCKNMVKISYLFLKSLNTNLEQEGQ